MKFISLVCILFQVNLVFAQVLSGQLVSFDVHPEATVFIDDKPLSKKDGVYNTYLPSRISSQLTVKLNGYLDENIVLTPNAKGTDLYDDVYTIKNTSLIADLAGSNTNRLIATKMKIDLPTKTIEGKHFSSLKKFHDNKPLRGGFGGGYHDDIISSYFNNEPFNPQNLNPILVEMGYQNPQIERLEYSKKYTLHSTLKNVHFINILRKASSASFAVEVEILWEVFNSYGEKLMVYSTTSSSGNFCSPFWKDSVVAESIEGGVKFGLLKLMKSDKMIHLMNSINIKEELEEVTIPKIGNHKHVQNTSDALKSTVTIINENNHGSGFVISEDGYIVTSYHVITNQKDSKVIFHDNSAHNYKVVQVNKEYDLALLKVDTNYLLPFKIRESKDIEIAEDIFVVGTPVSTELAATISKGIISGIRTLENNSKIIQTDASISSGHCGGVMIGKNGIVVGVVRSTINESNIEGVAFCIPSYDIFPQLNILFK